MYNFKTLSKKEQTTLFVAIEQLRKRPRLGKALVGKLAGLRSLETRVYRIIYRIQEEAELIVLVQKAGHKKDIYAKRRSFK